MLHFTLGPSDLPDLLSQSLFAFLLAPTILGLGILHHEKLIKSDCSSASASVSSKCCFPSGHICSNKSCHVAWANLGPFHCRPLQTSSDLKEMLLRTGVERLSEADLNSALQQLREEGVVIVSGPLQWVVWAELGRNEKYWMNACFEITWF